MFHRYITLALLGLMLVIIWMGHSPYLHDFGEWFYQGHILTLHWTRPDDVAAFQWAPYPVPNSLAVVLMAVLGLVLPPLQGAKLFLSLLLIGWYMVMYLFVRRNLTGIDSSKLLSLLFCLVVFSNFFWTGFVGYQLGLLLLTLFISRFSAGMSTSELALFAVLIFFSHAMVFLVFTLLVLVDIVMIRKRPDRILALLPVALLSAWFIVGRVLQGFNTPVADAAMAGWWETLIYKLGYPLLLGPFKNLLQPDLSSLFDKLPWFYWAGVVANIMVVAGLGLFVLCVLLAGSTRAAVTTRRTQPGKQVLYIAAWLLLLFYILAPYNFFGLINPSGRVTIPLLFLCLVLATGTPLATWLEKLLRVITPITLAFTFVTVLSYGVLIYRSSSQDYLDQTVQAQGRPPSSSVLDYNAWVYTQASYRYFNVRIFGFARRFDDVREGRHESLSFRTALLISRQELP